MPTPSDSQRRAIEASAGPRLVLAGPGAGKTFCLIERIAHLVETLGVAPARICAFTFTNKAAGEIAHRLVDRLGAQRAEQIKRGTIHAFCAELLREFPEHAGLQKGFGIADEAYQLTVLRRLEGPRRWHRNTLSRFSGHRFRGDQLLPNDAELFERYEEFVAGRNLADFDSLVLKAAKLLAIESDGADVRSRWDAILVDEFQDLNPVQYKVVRELARDHRHIFAVGDDEQSIYSWAGADPAVFWLFMNEFKITKEIRLEENRRCPQQVLDRAQRLIAINPPLFEHPLRPAGHLRSSHPVAAINFATDDAEVAWVVADVQRDHAAHEHAWGEVALLYRKHSIGEQLESAFLNAGMPVRLAQGRALAEDPVIAYVLAALRVMAWPGDDVNHEMFFAANLSRALFDEVRARAAANRLSVIRQLKRMAAQLPKSHEEGKQIRRALYQRGNLEAIARRHESLAPLVQELLSQRVGRQQSVLEEWHRELVDPGDVPAVRHLAERLARARSERITVRLPSLKGVEIAAKGMLAAVGIAAAYHDAEIDTDEMLASDGTPTLGFALGLFKALQFMETRDLLPAWQDFTAVDLETTDNDVEAAEIVEIAAVRVRDGKIVEEFKCLVKPRGHISEGATNVHGLRDEDVAGEPAFEVVWPQFRAFCGDDIIVAHNGYDFDFPVLNRLVKASGGRFDMCTFDTLPLARSLISTSCALPNLAAHFGIPPGRSHRALDDTRTLALVFVKLEEEKLSRARKTALANLLGLLGVALVLSDQSAPTAEQQLLARVCVGSALGRYSGALEYYEGESKDNESVPSADEVIDLLGGSARRNAVRADKTADDLYPSAMARLRRLIADIPDGPLAAQLPAFLERAVLSKWDGHEPERGRINLLTLHSTKGLEFSRVYVVGVEDTQLPGGSPTKGATDEEIQESRRLLYVGMTRAKERLVLTHSMVREGKATTGHRFLDEMDLTLQEPS